MNPNQNNPEEEKMYALLGKLFAHYCADKGVPLSPIAFKKKVAEIAKAFNTTEEELKKAFVFLNEKSIEFGFEDNKRVYIGFNAKTETT